MPMDVDAASQRKIDDIVADYSLYPALVDTSSPMNLVWAAFPGLASVVKHFREKSNHPAFINMFPNLCRSQACWLCRR